MAKNGILFDLPEFIFGAEGEENNSESASGDSSNDSGNDSGDHQENAGSSSNGDNEQNSSDDAAAALRLALENERKINRENAKKLKAFEKSQQEAEDKEKSESQRERDRADRLAGQLGKLASGYRTEKFNSAVRSAASAFVDPDDVIAALRDDDSIRVEQDEDDPSQVTIDQKTLNDAIKKLATKKPHWLKSGTDDGNKTGSQFGNGQGRQKKDTDEAMKERYPALRH